MVSSEWAPLASTGDLGETVGALARALARRGHDVVSVLPAYGGATDDPDDRGGESLGPLGDLPTAAGPRLATGWLSAPEPSGARTVRLMCPALYDRPGVYGDPEDYGDNPDRFWALTAGALAIVRRLGWTPDVAHSHDWHAGWLSAVIRSQSDFRAVRTVHSSYDLRMAGPASLDWARQLGVVGELLHAEGVEYYGRVSFAKVGLRFADAVVMNTPESAHAREGLAGVVRTRASSVTHIPRSIDSVAWDPDRDLGLPARFSSRALEGKAANKRRLQAAVGFEVNPRAVVVLSREDPMTAAGIKNVAGGSLVQWLPLDGLPPGLFRLAFAGADAVVEPSGDPWSALMRTAERYGLAAIIAEGPDVPSDAYAYDPAEPDSVSDAVARLTAEFAEPETWSAAVQARLQRDPEHGVDRHEMLYRQILSVPVGPPVPWAEPALLNQLKAAGAR